MKLFYVTFGQNHKHVISGKTITKDHVAVFHTEDYKAALNIVENLFSYNWCYLYEEKDWDPSNMIYFPKGLVTLDDNRRQGG